MKSAKAFVNAATSDPTRAKEIQPGVYTLRKHQSAKTALAALTEMDANGNPKNASIWKVVVPEGELSFDIFADLAKVTGLPVKQFTDAAKDPVALGVNPAWFTAKRDDGRKSMKSIEGFLFPATYSFAPGTSATDMLKAMVNKFNQVVGADGLNFMDYAKNTLKMTPYEALIAASIAQKEGRNYSEFTGIVRIMYNRIFSGTPDAGQTLGLDSEVNYWLRYQGKSAQESKDLTKTEIHDPKDPFNTHDVPGFPPQAISNPGEDALKAALHPNGKYKGYGYFQTVCADNHMVYSQDPRATSPRRRRIADQASGGGAGQADRPLTVAGAAQRRLCSCSVSIDWSYSAIECTEAELPDLLAGLDETWAGLSLTMPLKDAALAVADRGSARARPRSVRQTRWYAVTGGWRADNTDAPGMVDALRAAGLGAADRGRGARGRRHRPGRARRGARTRRHDHHGLRAPARRRRRDGRSAARWASRCGTGRGPTPPHAPTRTW